MPDTLPEDIKVRIALQVPRFDSLSLGEHNEPHIKSYF